MNAHPKTAGIATLACMAASLCFAVPAHAADDAGWQWMVAPYGWLASIGADADTSHPPSPISNDLTFNDIVDKIDGAFEMHVEGQGGHFGMFADFTYLGLTDHHDLTHFTSKTDLDSRLFEAAAVWSPGPERFEGFDLFGGLRYIDLDFTLRLYPVDPQFGVASVHTSESWSDFMIGARYTWALSDHWRLTVRGDGSFGDTDGTWNASAVAQYRTKHGAWLFGYRYLDATLKSSDGTRLSVNVNGPQIGYAFIF